MKHVIISILLLCPLLAFCDNNETDIAVRDLQRAIQMTDATMEHSFTGSSNNMRMYDLYDTETHQGSGTFVLGTGAHGASGLCPVNKESEAYHYNDAGRYSDQGQIRNGRGSKRNTSRADRGREHLAGG